MYGAETEILRRELRSAIEAAKRKADTTDEYGKFSELFKNNSLDPSLYRDFGWFIYYKLRATPHNMVLQRKRLMHLYLKLLLERPSLLHSLILFEAVIMKKNSPSGFRLKDFVAMWGLENLRPEDWEKKRLENGRTKNSLVENLIFVYVREITADNIAAPDDFICLLDKATNLYGSNTNLPVYKAMTLVSSGKTDEALACYKTLLKRWPKKFFLWNKAEKLLPCADLDLRIAFLSKAISYVKDDGLLGDTRLDLADLLITKGLLANALHELLQYERYYFSQNWRIKDRQENLLRLVKNSAPNILPSPTPYADFLPLADQYLSTVENPDI